MIKYAWIENDKIRDCCEGDPYLRFTPDVASYYSTLIPEHIQNGAELIDGVWTNRIIISSASHEQAMEFQQNNSAYVVAQKMPRLVTADEVRDAMTFAEKVRWDNNQTPTVVTAKREFVSARLIKEAKPVVQFMVDSGDIGQATMDALNLVEVTDEAAPTNL